jgi:sugar lactone lactonase YvrE/enterochelin esterase-like enzyme
MAATGIHGGLLAVLLAVATVAMAQDEPDYPLGPDSQRRPGVPEGRVEGPFSWESDIFPGTVRNYWIYVPAAYDAQQPACVMIVQDGIGRANEWRLPEVLDNLIEQGDVPVTIGIFVDPGVVPAAGEQAQPRFNRSFEYDSLGDRYARFLVDELLPEVAKSYNLSQDPNDRLLAGASSGGICAFTAAWERPDQFRRVLSTIGTFVGLRGGDQYPTLVRKFEPKPIRVFLQDGSRDLNIYGGDWWMANQSMLSALKFAGYDVRHQWGEGGHNGRHGAAIMPDALRWLWRDYPQPIERGVTPERRIDLVIPGQSWQLVSEGHQFTEGPAVNSRGEVFFTDIPQGKIFKIDLQGEVSEFVSNSPGVNGLMFSADGYLYACQNGNSRIVRYDEQGSEETVIEDAPSNDLVCLPDGIYYTDPTNQRVWYVDGQRNRTMVDQGIAFPNGIIPSADQSQLFVADTRGRFVYVSHIQTDGTLAHRQPFGYLHLPDDGSDSGADGMTVDSQGRLYVTTRLGVQVLDQLGRVHLILEKPQANWLSNVVFGGAQFDTLFATCGDKVFKRKLRARGVVPWQGPRPEPRPHL